jgi:hypothetical protein
MNELDMGADLVLDDPTILRKGSEDISGRPTLHIGNIIRVLIRVKIGIYLLY